MCSVLWRLSSNLLSLIIKPQVVGGDKGAGSQEKGGVQSGGVREMGDRSRWKARLLSGMGSMRTCL